MTKKGTIYLYETDPPMASYTSIYDDDEIELVAWAADVVMSDGVKYKWDLGSEDARIRTDMKPWELPTEMDADEFGLDLVPDDTVYRRRDVVNNPDTLTIAIGVS